MPVGTFTSRVEYTAASWEDVLPAFKDFLTSDTTLSNAGETWTVEYFHDDRQDFVYNYQQLVVKMPGYGSPFQDGTFVFVTVADLQSDKQAIIGGALPSGFSSPQSSLYNYPLVYTYSYDRFVVLPMAKNNLVCHFYANAVSAGIIVQSSGNTHGIIFGWSETFMPTSDWARAFVMLGHTTQYANNSGIPSWTDSSSYITKGLATFPEDNTRIDPNSIYYSRESHNSPLWTVLNPDTNEEVLIAHPLHLYTPSAIPCMLAPCVYVTSSQGVGQGDTFTSGGGTFYVYDDNGNGITGMHALRYGG